MKPTDNIPKLIKKLHVEPSDDLDRKVHSRITRALAQLNQTPSAEPQPPIWRSIMNSKITKLTAAAVIMLALGAGLVTILTNGATPAYALQQTFEAMRKIDILHIFLTNPQGDQLEAWIKVDPDTGENLYHHIYNFDKGITWVSTPKKSYYYESETNIVRIADKPILYSGFGANRAYGRFVGRTPRRNGRRCHRHNQQRWLCFRIDIGC